MTIDTKAIREEAAHGFVVRPTVLALLDAYEAGQAEVERLESQLAEIHTRVNDMAQRFDTLRQRAKEQDNG